MLYSDAIGLTVCLSFGIWFVFAPSSVIRFYSWFHSRQGIAGFGKARVPRPIGVRVAGLLWILLITIVFVVSRKK
jgi:hypothetical protein